MNATSFVLLGVGWLLLFLLWWTQREALREWERWAQRFDRLVAESADERARFVEQINKMADRIQFPEVRQVEPGEVREYEPPTDSAELAQVGQIMFGNGSEG